MRYDYPFKTTYIPNWNLKDALREFISNAKDGETQHGATMKLSYDATTRTAKITNVGISLNHSVLLMGGSDKSSDSRLIGRHHEGLKMAMLVCAREHLPVRIRNGRNEVWVPSLEYSPKWGDKILMLDVKQSKRQVENFDVEITGLDPELWTEATEMFLFLRPNVQRVETDSGDILMNPELAGKIFVKGVYVCDDDMRQGYDFKDISLDRDRNIPPRWELNTAIRHLWMDYLDRAPSEANHIYDIIDKKLPEAEAFRYSDSDKLIDALVGVFHTRHGTETIPVVSHEEIESLSHFGEKGALVSHDLANKLHVKLPSVQKLRSERRADVLQTFSPADLTEDENATFSAAFALIHDLYPKAAGRITIVQFRDEKLQGIHVGDTIQIARSVLASYGETLMLLIHELSHDEGVDGGKNHVDCMHRLTVQAFERLRKESL